MDKHALVYHLANAAYEVSENLAYILKELPQLPAPVDIKHEVASVCLSCEENAYVVFEEIRSLEGRLRATVFSDAWFRPDGLQTIRIIQENIENCVLKMHPIVKRLESLKSRDQTIGTLYVLVTESALNVLNAKTKIDDFLTEIRKHLPPALPGGSPHPLDSFVPPKAIYLCSVCGAIAGVVIFLPFVSNESISMDTGIVRLMGVIGVEQGIGKEDTPKLLAALASGNPSDLYKVDELRAPFFCPQCDLVYCKNHLELDVRYEEDFHYDATYATCPQKHRRMIDD